VARPPPDKSVGDKVDESLEESLIVLSTLPAIWNTYDSGQISDGIAVALVSMLSADFVHVVLPGWREAPGVEATRTGIGLAAGAVGAIRIALQNQPLRRSTGQTAEQTAEIANPWGEGTMRLSYAPIGLGGEAVLVAGSHRADFPTQAQRLLLGIGANEAAIALQRWQAEADKRRYLALIERSSDFIGVAGLDGVPQYVNPAGLRLVGLASIEVARRMHILNFVFPDDRARMRDEVWPIVMREGRWIGEINLRHLELGTEVPLLVDWFRVDDPRTGQPMNIATVSRDLRLQKRAEAAMRRLNETLEHRVAERTVELAHANLKLKAEIGERERSDLRVHDLLLELFHAARLSEAGQMTAALAHELNQPLTAATNSVNAARRLLAKDHRQTLVTVREIMEEAAADTMRAGEIVRRLRDFVIRRAVEMKEESVKSIVEEACAFVLIGAKASGVRVNLRFDPNASQVLADRIQIQQVLVNLLRNSIEAMADSKRRELRVTTALVNAETVEIAVADTGTGLAKGVAERLFEPFVSTKHDGMGLGLSICRSIVEGHGGRLRGEPNPHGGTIFRFTLATTSRTGGADAS
jgi:PAS domain S-box-containing protein